MSKRMGILFFLTVAFVAEGATLTVERITNDAVDLKGGLNVFKRDPYTSLGRILFVDTADNIYLYDGSVLPPPVIDAPLGASDSVADHVLMLGHHSVSGQVLAGWRRAAGYGEVSVNGAAPAAAINLNPEAISVADGCVFMVLQTVDGNHAYKIDPATGGTTKLSSGTATVGAGRITSSGCKAAWTYQTNANENQIQYWDGTTTIVLEPEASQPRMAGGRIAYSKLAGGITQVFVVDTADPALTKVQVSSEDGTKAIQFVETDGRHVIWMRGTPNVNAELVLAGGLVFPTPVLAQFSNERGVQLDRGQMLWITPAGSLTYFDGADTYPIDPAPATTVDVPWLADGYIAFLGLHQDGGTDKEVFRITGTTPADSQQPAPPLYVQVTQASGNATVKWDRVLGATSYNLYVANEPGVTKDNYATLKGGQKITGVTSGHIVPLAVNKSYFFAVSAVEGAAEGPSSRIIASTTRVGTLNWTAVGPASTPFYSVAASSTSSSLVLAGGAGSVHRSTDGGRTWSEVLLQATTVANRVAALGIAGSSAYAVTVDEGDVWKSTDSGANWGATPLLDAGNPGELNASLAIDPSNPANLFAGDFNLPSKTIGDSYVIKSVTSGASWTHTPEPVDEIRAYALAVDPGNGNVVYAGGSGTPNFVKSTNGGASWTGDGVPGFGAIYSIAVDPRDTDVVYVTVQHRGVFKSEDGGLTWTAKNNGISGVAVNNFGGAGFHSILIDPDRSEYLHLGAGNGYWYSIDGGDNWTAANAGFPGGTEWIYGLTITPTRRLIAATSSGLYLLSLAPAPTVTSVSPTTGSPAGGTNVTITGTGFQQGATVTFGSNAATNVVVGSSTSITATTPAGSGTVGITVTNFDGQSGTGAGLFTYLVTPPAAPTGVTAAAETTTSVLVSWNAAASATLYEVFRRGPGEVGYTSKGTTASLSLTDTTALANTTYYYRANASNSAGSSPDSASDIATTVLFTNEPLTTGTAVQAAHIAQCRAAINAVRQFYGLGAASYTHSAAAGTTVRALDISQMRTALDAALGAPPGGYTDASLAGVSVKAVHVQQIRDRVK